MSGDAIDEALIAALKADATLTALVPGSWHRDIAPPSVSEPFGIVTLMAHEDVLEQSPREAHQIGRYLVKAMGQGTAPTAVKTAAARVHVVLQNAALSITGFTTMTVHREERIAYVEADGPARWQHRGGIYAVWACPV